METIYLSRRNLLTLLSKLDRKAAGEETACSLIKNDNQHPKFAQTLDSIMVIAVDDDEYYTDRSPGLVRPEDTPSIITAEMVRNLRDATDAPMMECKKALYMAKGDHDEAIKLINNYEVNRRIHSCVTYDWSKRGWEPK